MNDAAMDVALAERSSDSLVDELATLAAGIAAASGRFQAVLGELERRGGAVSDEFASLAHWLSWRCSLDLKTAREQVRVAKVVRELPRTLDALTSGTITYAKARAISRVARPETEEKLVDLARHATAAQLERICSAMRRADPEGERMAAGAIEERRKAVMFFDEDGMLVVRARLAPDEGAVFMRAMEAARDALWKDRKTDIPAERQRADALAMIADRSLSEGAGARTGGDRVMVMVHVDEAVLADPSADGESRFERGPDASAEASRRLACDASVVEVHHAADGTIHPGRRTRVVGAALRRALEVRDHGTCSFPGCSHGIVDAHHLVHWANGGPTELENLTLLCRFHHTLVHERGYQVTLANDVATFHRPDGSIVPLVPPLMEGRFSAVRGTFTPTSLTIGDPTARIDWNWLT